MQQFDPETEERIKESVRRLEEVMGGIVVLFVTVNRQPVLRREPVTVDGEEKPKRAKLYVRTKEVLETREERLVRFEGRRAVISWGGAHGPLVEIARFSLATGRLIGNADWTLSSDALKALRALARKFKEADDDDAGDDADERSPMEIAEDDAAKNGEG